MDRTLVKREALRHLSEQRTTLWSQFYDLGEETDVEAAAEWLTNQIVAVMQDRLV